MIASVRAAGVEYYGVDALGSTRVAFDAAGAVTARSDYKPFGEGVNVTGWLPAERFTGQERDEEGGLDYFNARMYQPRAGRFTAVDPVFSGALIPASWNRYAYVLNDPLRFTDPSGETFCLECVSWVVTGGGTTITVQVVGSYERVPLSFDSVPTLRDSDRLDFEPRSEPSRGGLVRMALTQS
jgi:RHS repeat-associated protein